MNLVGRLFNGFFVLIALLWTFTNLTAEQLSEWFALTDSTGIRVSLRETRRKAEQLKLQNQSIAERECCKQRIAEALNNGQLPLVEAAACYRSLYEAPKSWRNPNRPRPQHDDGESWCREVIEWTERDSLFDHSPGHADALHQRLEEELQEQLESNGVVILPE